MQALADLYSFELGPALVFIVVPTGIVVYLVQERTRVEVKFLNPSRSVLNEKTVNS